jgi:hypothetical protein
MRRGATGGGELLGAGLRRRDPAMIGQASEGLDACRCWPAAIAAPGSGRGAGGWRR